MGWGVDKTGSMPLSSRGPGTFKHGTLGFVFSWASSSWKKHCCAKWDTIYWGTLNGATSFKILLSGKCLWPTMLMLYSVAKRCLSNTFWTNKMLTVFDRSFVVYNNFSNFFKHDQTGVESRKYLVKKQCLIVLDRQAFPFGQGALFTGRTRTYFLRAT